MVNYIGLGVYGMVLGIQNGLVEVKIVEVESEIINC